MDFMTSWDRANLPPLSLISAQLALSCGYRHLKQTQVARHRMEVGIVVQQRPAVLNAPGADKHVDGLVNGDFRAWARNGNCGPPRRQLCPARAMSCDRSDLWTPQRREIDSAFTQQLCCASRAHRSTEVESLSLLAPSGQ